MQLPRKKSSELESKRGSISSRGSGSDSTGEVSTRSGPGATSVSGGTTVVRGTVPNNVRPGVEFEVYAGSCIVRVRCFLDSRPGQLLQITVPAEDVANPRNNTRNPNLQPDSPNVRRINDPNARGGHAAYMVTIPEGVRVGQQFPVTIQGQQLVVTCPQNARPGIDRKSTRLNSSHVD